MPQPGTEPVTFWCTGHCSSHWATWPGPISHFLRIHTRHIFWSWDTFSHMCCLWIRLYLTIDGFLDLKNTEYKQHRNSFPVWLLIGVLLVEFYALNTSVDFWLQLWEQNKILDPLPDDLTTFVLLHCFGGDFRFCCWWGLHRFVKLQTWRQNCGRACTHFFCSVVDAFWIHGTCILEIILISLCSCFSQYMQPLGDCLFWYVWVFSFL